MHFIAVSANTAQRTQLSTLVAHAAQLVGAGTRAARGDDAAPADPANSATTWLCVGALPCIDDGALVVAGRQPALVATADLRRVELAEMARRWHGLGCPPAWPAAADFTPPFALALLDRRRDSVRVVTDAIGLSHVYVAQGDGVAVVSSSALACAQLLGRGIDAAAMFGMAQTGSMIGTDTPFAGVRKLAAGDCATLHDGVLAVTAMAAPATPDSVNIDDAARVLRSVMTALAAQFPEAEFELSGGMDSRLLLAALPAPARAAHAGFTIGTPDAPDVVVAKLIAAREGMAHSVADPDAVLATVDLPPLLDKVAHDHQFSTNPLDRVLIAAIGQQFRAPRFSGQNGEALRGFYYAGQRLGAEPTRAMALRLVDWRLLANDSVDPQLFSSAFVAAQRPALRDRLADIVLDCRGITWAQKIDTLYERERMQHWCGIGISGICHERQILMPFFDPRMTAFARAVAPREKAGARLAARLLAALDAGLAGLPLDSGMSPRALATGGVRSLLARTGAVTKKALRKIGQRLRRQPAATVSASSTTAMFWAQIGAAGLDVAPLRHWGIFDNAALDRFVDGSWRPDRPTLGFLINCSAMARVLGAHARIEGGCGNGTRNAIDTVMDGVSSSPSTPLLAASE
jgi:asparagine synthase (glutamine-hydrolysing)